MIDSRTPTPSIARSSELDELPGRYHVRRVLGAGAQKRVYLADDDVLERPVAISAVLKQELSGSTLAHLREARAMARIGEHPHVVSIYDVVETDAAIFLIAQYLPGGDLARELDEQKTRLVSVRRAIRIGIQICQALEVAHDRGVIHRDVKPGNVFLSEGGDCLLGDFGLASSARVSEVKAQIAPEDLVGTPDYMAPELVTGTSASPSSDLYSLGCLLYELVSGAPPFGSGDAVDTILRHQIETPEPLVGRFGDVPIPLDDLVLGLLSKKPEQRPRRARDVRAALEGIRAQLRPNIAATSLRIAPIPGKSPILRVVGRELEQARAEATIETAISGSPRILVVRAEAGAGKTALIDQCRTTIARRGAVALTGAADEKAAAPYHAITEAILPVLGNLSGVADDDADSVRKLIFDDHAELDSSPFSNDEDRRRRAISGFARALSMLGGRRPIVLIIDNAQWLDSASQQLLRFLAGELHDLAADGEEVRVGIVLCLRPDADFDLSGIVDGEHADVLDLEPLPEGAVHQIVSQLGIPRPSEELIHDLTQATRGNPLLIRELVDLLSREGSLQDREGSTVSIRRVGEIGGFDTATHAAHARIARLSEECRSLLVEASLLGLRVEVRRLSALRQTSVDALLDRLDEAVNAGVLIDEGQTYRFAHPSTAQALRSMPTPTRRQRLHLRVAHCLIAERNQGGRGSAGEIAHHLIAAGDAAPVEELLVHTREAAELAWSRFAWRETIQFLGSAVQFEAARSRLSIFDRGAIHHRLGRAYNHLGDAGPCIHHLDLARDAFKHMNDVEALGIVLHDKTYAETLFGLVPFGQLGDLKPIQDVLAGLGERSPRLRARLMVAMAERFWVAQRSPDARALCETAWSLALESNDFELMGVIHRMKALASWQELELETSISEFREGALISMRAQSPLEEDRNRARLPLVLAMAGRLDEAVENALAVRGIDRADALLATTARILVDCLRGNRNDAESLTRRTVDQLRRSRQIFAALFALPALSFLRSMANDPAGAEEAYDQLLRPGLAFEDPNAVQSLVAPFRALIRYHSTGRADPTDVDFAPFSHPATELSLYTLTSACAQIELAEGAGRTDVPDGLIAALARAEARGVLFTPGWCFSIPRVRALAASLRREREQAFHHYERAALLARTAGVAFEEIRARLGIAELLAAGDETSRSRAIQTAGSVVSTFRESGPIHLLERAEKLAGRR